ncbi:hypothetical protein [Bacillus sp. CECT 9360]|uniref:hypothetical protein n=1 Tax=Bacillus sp. CECT 9360 TaxID=2845821 RepID=UPI001E65CBAB|nr:hypothetical protein [Bacillus sp. CECT 9360]CAH0343979.1 hypothetical protein BCI9360_00207 [Bacillus sp. CECT 9360]
MFTKKRKKSSPVVIRKIVLSDSPRRQTATFGSAVIDSSVEITAVSPEIKRTLEAAKIKKLNI